jgi:hypothetical protein
MLPHTLSFISWPGSIFSLLWLTAQHFCFAKNQTHSGRVLPLGLYCNGSWIHHWLIFLLTRKLGNVFLACVWAQVISDVLYWCLEMGVNVVILPGYPSLPSPLQTLACAIIAVNSLFLLHCLKHPTVPSLLQSRSRSRSRSRSCWLSSDKMAGMEQKKIPFPKSPCSEDLWVKRSRGSLPHYVHRRSNPPISYF